MSTTTAWVKPASRSAGLDDLGTQAPAIAIYSDLLPGITNVTSRARYYSFYPWLLRSIENRLPRITTTDFRTVLRKAECLLGLDLALTTLCQV